MAARRPRLVLARLPRVLGSFPSDGLRQLRFDVDVDSSAQLPGAQNESEREEQQREGAQNMPLGFGLLRRARRAGRPGQRAFHAQGDTVRFSAVGVVDRHARDPARNVPCGWATRNGRPYNELRRKNASDRVSSRGQNVGRSSAFKSTLGQISAFAPRLGSDLSRRGSRTWSQGCA